MNCLGGQQIVHRVYFRPFLTGYIMAEELKVMKHDHLNKGVLEKLVVHPSIYHLVNFTFKKSAGHWVKFCHTTVTRIRRLEPF